MSRCTCGAALVVALGLLLPGLIGGAPQGTLLSVTDIEVAAGSYFEHPLEGLLQGQVLVLTLVANASVDLYLLGDADYPANYPGNFTEGIVGEDVVSVSQLEWSAPRSGRFHLVVENLDSQRSADAVPTDAAHFSLEVEDRGILDDTPPDLSNLAIVLLAAILLVTVVMVLSIVFLTRRLRRRIDQRDLVRQAELFAKLDRIDASIVPPGPSHDQEP